MDIITYALCKKMFNDISSKISTVFTIKGKVSTIDDLPLEGNQSGDVYLVGPQEDNSYNEYYWNESIGWDLLGSTSSDLSSYITEENLYKGQDGSGTPDNPAKGTILAAFKKEVVSENEVQNLIDKALDLEII